MYTYIKGKKLLRTCLIWLISFQSNSSTISPNVFTISPCRAMSVDKMRSMILCLISFHVSGSTLAKIFVSGWGEYSMKMICQVTIWDIEFLGVFDKEYIIYNPEKQKLTTQKNLKSIVRVTKSRTNSTFWHPNIAGNWVPTKPEENIQLRGYSERLRFLYKALDSLASLVNLDLHYLTNCSH